MDWFKKHFAPVLGGMMLLGTLMRACLVDPTPQGENPFAGMNWGSWSLESTANALSNPQKTGSNFTMVANATPQQVAAQSANCSVLLQVDFDPKDGGACPTCPICSGYNSTTPLVPLTKWNCVMPLCTDTTRCVANWVVRDTVPGAIWVIGLNPDGGGVPVRGERGAGCQNP